MQDWKTRWCVLRGAAFLYYKEQDMAKEQGACALTPAHSRVARVRGRTRGTYAVCAARAVDLNGATLDDNPDMDILSPVKSKHHKTGAPAPSRHRATAATVTVTVLVSPS